MTAQLRFLGAAETVTGSRFLIESDGKRLLIDCGLFQGLKKLRSKNWAAFPVKPASIDAVILTHAHIDHSGYLPALVKQGFKGSIYSTPASLALCEILLPDSAYLQEEEARFANKSYSEQLIMDMTFNLQEGLPSNLNQLVIFLEQPASMSA